MPQDFIPNPTIQEKISAVTLNSSGKEEVHIVTLAIDPTKITRMNNIYIDVHDNSGAVVCHTTVLSSVQIQNLKELLKKKTGRKITYPLGGKPYSFQKEALSKALEKLEKEKQTSSSFGFSLSFSLSVGF